MLVLCHLQLHLVYYNSAYGSFTQAVDKPDGLAVVAVLLKVHVRVMANHVIQIVRCRTVYNVYGSIVRLARQILNLKCRKLASAY